MPPYSDPLHSFTLSAAEKMSQELELPSKLDLGVLLVLEASNIGIAGREMTLVSGGDGNQSGHVIGRGIIGWN
jgi:hypothetical protein